MPDPQHKYVQKAVSRAWNLYWYWAWCWCYHRSLPELPPAPANFSKLLPTANLSSIQDTAWPCATLAQFPPKHPGCPVWVALCFGCFIIFGYGKTAPAQSGTHLAWISTEPKRSVPFQPHHTSTNYLPRYAETGFFGNNTSGSSAGHLAWKNLFQRDFLYL